MNIQEYSVALTTSLESNKNASAVAEDALKLKESQLKSIG